MSQTKPYAVVFDTNLLLDLALTFRSHHDDASALYFQCQQANVSTRCVPLSLKDVFYIVPHLLRNKVKGNKSESDVSRLELTTVNLIATKLAWAAIQHIHETFEEMSIGPEESEEALRLREQHNDYEDNLIVASATLSGSDCVATYDKRMVADFPHLCAMPAQILNRL